MSKAARCALFVLLCSLASRSRADEIAASTAAPIAIPVSSPTVVYSTPTPIQFSTSAWITMIYPPEGAKLPPVKETFVYGAVVAGSTLTINGSTITVHPKGGYLAMIPIMPGNILLNLDAKAKNGELAHFERRFSVSSLYTPLPLTPAAIVKESIYPSEDMLLTPGDTLKVSFQGTPQGDAEFSIEDGDKHLPMVEIGSQGIYEGSYVIPADGDATKATITVTLRKGGTRTERAVGHLSIESGGAPRVGLITDDTVASRTAADGGYDVFLYRGMKVRLTGKTGNQWRVRLGGTQSGWVKESAIQELPRGTRVPQSLLTNMTMVHEPESTIIKIPLAEILPYRVEQTLEPPTATITVFGAANKTDLIKYDPKDPLIRIVRWRQISPDACQIVVEPRFKKWWGFDVRYEGSTMVIEVRKPWTNDSLKGMVIAVDPGHGGSDSGAIGPHGTQEKVANLEIAKVVLETLEKAGAKPFLTRAYDMDVPLYERGRIAWRNKARLFVSVHCNASGVGENPIWNNGSSVYFYQPQSQALAEAVHAGYREHVATLPDHGLFYADLAVCRMTQMPAILTEQAYIILPEQEDMIFDPRFQRRLANAIVTGIKNFIKP